MVLDEGPFGMATWYGVDRSHPAMDLPIHDQLASVRQDGREGIETKRFDLFVTLVGEPQRCIACD